MNSSEFTSVHDQEYSREAELAAIYRAGLAVASTLDLQKVLTATVESAAKLLQADAVTLHKYNRVKAHFEPPPVAVGVSESFRQFGMPNKDGSAAIIAKTGEPIIASDAKNHPKINQEFIHSERIESSAGFPLKVDHNVVGVLFLNYRSHHEFSTEDIEKVTIFAGLAAIAIHNAELFRQQEAATKRLSVLQQAQKAIDSASELREVLSRILEEGLKVVETQRGSLMLLERNKLVTRAQFGPELSDPNHTTMTFELGEGIAGHVAKTGEAILCSDVLRDTRFKHPANDKMLRFRSLLTVPIISRDDKVIGVISADDPAIDHFNDIHKQLLTDMAGQFAAAIERMILVETLRALSKIFERITSVAISSRELPPVLEEIAKNALEILGIDVITIYQYDQVHNTFVFPPLMRGDISQTQQMKTPVHEGEATWILVHKLKHHHYASDARQDEIMNPKRPPGKGPGFVEREDIKSSAGLLLKVGDEIVGVMFINYKSQHEFPDREKQIIETFANVAAIAIQDARQWENIKNTQAQLVQTEKMSAVGTLASGIAHELKNPLSNILSSVNILETGRVAQEEVASKFSDIKREVRRASNIIESLLGFVRPSEIVREPVDILALVNESLNLLEGQARLNHVNIEPQLMHVPPIQGNSTALRQVFFNILKNAIEAMPEGGRVTVKTSTDNVRIRVEVQDTGPGIRADIKSHIFEPFVTTKEVGKGTGLGLAVSYKIVHDHGGDIKVESEEGKGSNIIVILPIGE